MVAIPLMRQLVMEGLMSVPRPHLPRISVMAIALMLCAALLGFITLAILLIAEYLYLSQFYTAPLAALMVAGTSLALSLLMGVAAKIASYNKKHPRPDKTHLNQPDMAKTLTALIDSLAEELEEPIRDNPKTAVAIAGLAGFLTGDQVRP